MSPLDATKTDLFDVIHDHCIRVELKLNPLQALSIAVEQHERSSNMSTFFTRHNAVSSPAVRNPADHLDNAHRPFATHDLSRADDLCSGISYGD